MKPCACVVRAVNEATEAIDTAMRRVETRWCSLAARAASIREKVIASSVVGQFYVELDAVRSLVAVYDTWVTGGDRPGDDFMTISRQLEHCRVRQTLVLFSVLNIHQTLNSR